MSPFSNANIRGSKHYKCEYSVIIVETPRFITCHSSLHHLGDGEIEERRVINRRFPMMMTVAYVKQYIYITVYTFNIIFKMDKKKKKHTYKIFIVFNTMQYQRSITFYSLERINNIPTSYCH